LVYVALEVDNVGVDEVNVNVVENWWNYCGIGENIDGTAVWSIHVYGSFNNNWNVCEKMGGTIELKV
jgi:hypothetical protein